MDKEPNKPEVDQVPAPEGDSTEMESLGKGRRRFIKSAIVMAPIILTVASRPVWARNCTLSGQLSGNLSDEGPPCGGEGCTADFWEANPDKWHYAYCRSKSFNEAFGVNAFRDDPTLYDVITQASNVHPNNRYCMREHRLEDLGREAVAALQNSATRVSFELEVCQVKADFISNYFSECYYVKIQGDTFHAKNGEGCPFLV